MTAPVTMNGRKRGERRAGTPQRYVSGGTAPREGAHSRGDPARARRRDPIRGPPALRTPGMTSTSTTAGPRRPRARWYAAGTLLAAAAGAGVGHLVAGFVAPEASPVLAVGSTV